MKKKILIVFFFIIFFTSITFTSSEINPSIITNQDGYDYLKIVLERNNIDSNYLKIENIKKVDLADSVNIIKIIDEKGEEDFIVTKESVDNVKINLGLSDCKTAEDKNCFEESYIRNSAVIKFIDADGNIKHLITNKNNIVGVKT